MFMTIWETAERLVLRNFDTDRDSFIAEITDTMIDATIDEVLETYKIEQKGLSNSRKINKEYLIRLVREEVLANYDSRMEKGNALAELVEHLEWLECHNKQYTKEQYSRIDEALELAKTLENKWVEGE